MTITLETNRVDYTGDGNTDTYSYTFYISSQDDLQVTTADDDGVETELTLTTDYTVTGVGLAGGGTVVLVAGDLTDGYHITIRRKPTVTQETDIRNQGEFYPETHEDALDALVMIDQKQQDEIDRSVKTPVTIPTSTFDPTLPVGITTANVFLKTNSSGTGWDISSSVSGTLFWYPSIDVVGKVAPSGLPSGSGAIGYDSTLDQIAVWVPEKLEWRIIA